ncbi:MAG: hypothetical protein IJ874_00210 [Ruminococcus sp.]|nr:hypothetical protein [Ruminococcus sp.]
MRNTRDPKFRYNGGSKPESRKAQQGADKEQDALSMIEHAMDEHASGIAQIVTDMFKFMSMSASMLPQMELDVGIMRLKVDDDGVFFEIVYPKSRKNADRTERTVSLERMVTRERTVCDDCDGCDGFDGIDSDDYDEEGLLYDGD